MILHLREKMVIKMMTSQKFEYKAEGYGKQWDPTTSITAYFTALDKSAPPSPIAAYPPASTK